MFRAALFLSGVALLVLALWLRRRQIRNGTTPDVWIQPPEEDWVHHGFDPREIAPRLEAVRQTHADIVHTRQSDLSYQSELLLQARRAVRLLSFFQQQAQRSEKN